jgi:hypothetical protein
MDALALGTVLTPFLMSACGAHWILPSAPLEELHFRYMPVGQVSSIDPNCADALLRSAAIIAKRHVDMHGSEGNGLEGSDFHEGAWTLV